MTQDHLSPIKCGTEPPGAAAAEHPPEPPQRAASGFEAALAERLAKPTLRLAKSGVPMMRPTTCPRTGCEHPRTELVRIDCGAGGMQYRCYCTSCWKGTDALPHNVVRAVIGDAEPPLADLEQLHAARRAYLRDADFSHLGLQYPQER